MGGGGHWVPQMFARLQVWTDRGAWRSCWSNGRAGRASRIRTSWPGLREEAPGRGCVRDAGLPGWTDET